MFERVPEAIKKLDQWVCANNGSKVPMRADTNAAASSSNPITWSSFVMAEQAVANEYYDNIGFVFADNGIVGIDIDAGFDEMGLLSPLACDIIGKCKSYTEKSRSGRGFHILLKGDLPFKGKNNGNGVEIYKTGRYFIMTGNVLLFDQIVDNQDAIDYIVGKYFPDSMREFKSESSSQNRIYRPVWQKWKGKRIPIQPTYPKIKQGSRNISLASLAGFLHNVGYNRQQIVDELTRCNQIACDPPVDKAEIKSIASSITRYRR